MRGRNWKNSYPWSPATRTIGASPTSTQQISSFPFSSCRSNWLYSWQEAEGLGYLFSLHWTWVYLFSSFYLFDLCKGILPIGLLIYSGSLKTSSRYPWSTYNATDPGCTLWCRLALLCITIDLFYCYLLQLNRRANINQLVLSDQVYTSLGNNPMEMICSSLSRGTSNCVWSNAWFLQK